MKQAIVCCVLLLGLVTLSWGQDSPVPHAPLLDTLGEYHRPVTTTSRLAQSYFDQGLRLIYGYYFTEAVASFREAIRLDPNCAMAQTKSGRLLGDRREWRSRTAQQRTHWRIARSVIAWAISPEITNF